MNKRLLTLLCVLGLFLPLSSVFAGTVLSAYKYAWSNNAGYINFGDVSVFSGRLSGYAWSANYGWIKFDPALGGVSNNGNGDLSGSAWGEQLGWIDFGNVNINPETGKFSGTATGTLMGTLTFDCGRCDVRTDWRPGETTGSGGVGYVAGSTPLSIPVRPTSWYTAISASAVTPNADTIADPRDLQGLLQALGLTRNVQAEVTVDKLVRADAMQFSVTVTDVQAAAMTNFIVYGRSLQTIRLGQGERRAIVRDYLETVGRANINWVDVERMVNGQIPIARNLAIERKNLSLVLPVFRYYFGHDPNFKNEKENLAWNTMLYRIRFPRDLVKEMKGIMVYISIYRRLPSSPFSWAVVRFLGYVR